MANETLLSGGPDLGGPGLGRPEQPAQGRLREVIGSLFPQAPFREAASSRGTRVARAANAAIRASIVGLGAVVLLLRVPGVPAWKSAYQEDWAIFLPSALRYPWHLFIPYEGYEDLGPRLIAELVASLPIVDAAAGFAIAGALIASACALFMYHASDGHIQTRWLRAMLGAALLFLPLAPAEIIDSGVDTVWYAMTASFFAVLWRPRGWPGMAAAALITFYACSSELVACVIFMPLVMMRLVALPRWRDHAATAGWLAGTLLQVVVVIKSYIEHVQRLDGTRVPLARTASLYFHDVALPSFGWHLAQCLIRIAGLNGATVFASALLAILAGWALIAGGRRVRMFTVTALVVGFAEAVFTATFNIRLGITVTPHAIVIHSPRYATLPILLIQAIAVVAVDSALSRRGGWRVLPARHSGGRGIRARSRLGAIIAATALVGVLGSGWVADYRYPGLRSQASRYWSPHAQAWVDACDRHPGGKVIMAARGPYYWRTPWWVKVECSRLRR